MAILEKVFGEITPPFIKKTIDYFLNKGTGKSGNPLYDSTTIIDTIIVDPILLGYSTGKPIFTIPSHKLRYHGGLAYTYDQHHFLRYYRGGRAAFQKYYENHQPGNIFEKHFLKVPDRPNILKSGEGRWLYGVPWLYTHEGTHKEESGLSLSHGEQAYGPVSEKKLRLEMNRLDNIHESLKKRGHQPQGIDGYPRGYFLIDSNSKWVFLLGAGLHRVAAMVHLGYTSIPVQFKQFFPRIIKESDCSEWPMVKKGCLSEEEALQIFNRYMEGVPVKETVK
ncbi:MAG: hypothetical protein WD267_03830 [Balneolales bacterium]